MRYLAFITLGLLLLHPGAALGFEPISDCVIDNFVSDITLREDSSLLIVEDLDVNCGNLPDKHGIFRIIPTKAPDRTQGEYALTPVKLLGITNESGNNVNYSSSTNKGDHTVTWKIGDPDITIQGINHYKISYVVQNAVVSRDGRDKLRWNLNGNFWLLPTNKLNVKVHLPSSRGDTTTQVFAGMLGETGNTAASLSWLDDKTIQVESTRPLNIREGVTLEAEFPEGLVTIFTPSFVQKYGRSIYLGILFLIFALVFGYAYRTWHRHGRELITRRPVTVEFDPPKGLGPLEVGLYAGKSSNAVISATIIDLAIRGYLKIEEIQGGLLKKKDWKLILIKEDVQALNENEQSILRGLFGTLTVGSETLISSLKNKFYTTSNSVAQKVNKSFVDRGWWDPISAKKQMQFLITGFILLFVFGFFFFDIPLMLTTLACAGVLILFGALMSRRTEEGAETLRLIKGFQLYMRQAEKHRMQFYEKENIFEKYLPYAIAFGLTGIWIKAFKSIYGAEAVKSYAPMWYAGHSVGGFDFNSFESQMNSISSEIGSTLVSSPSGSGSGGSSSGGGGGGGGGGSW